MKRLISSKVARVIKNRKRLEKKLGVNIANRGKEVFIEGNPLNEYVAEKVIDALDFGFPFSTAMLIQEEDFSFEVINIKDHTKRKDLERIRARIIGAKGGTLKALSELTKCFLELKDNSVGVIGEPEDIKNAEYAIVSLIQGTKQSNVYSYLEKHKPIHTGDLGLKE